MFDISKFKYWHSWVRDELKSCTDFWLRYGIDPEYGGVYTCLDRKGNIYSTDKSVWMQGRCAWTYAYLCTVYGIRDEWLEASKSCLDFMERYCINREADGRMYFTVTADGRPLRQRRYCFSEGFYTIANAEYYYNTGEKDCLERARRAYELVYDLNNGLISDPTGMGPKTIPGTRRMRAMADPMIFLNITAIMRRCDPERTEYYDEKARECAGIITRYHYKPELSCTLESVGMNGEAMLDITAGRQVNPGHDIECSWFLLDEAEYEGSDELCGNAINIFDQAVRAGWDEKYGGLLYFTDCLGKPPEAYEHDMKLWWTHNEMLIASLKIYRKTKNEGYLDSFYAAADYCREHFADPEYGEWYGYLRRDGLPTEPPCKGSTFKGPFHVQRSLIIADQMMNDIEGEK